MTLIHSVDPHIKVKVENKENKKHTQITEYKMWNMHTDKNKNEKTVGYLANIVSFVYPEPMLKLPLVLSLKIQDSPSPPPSLPLSLSGCVYLCIWQYRAKGKRLCLSKSWLRWHDHAEKAPVL